VSPSPPSAEVSASAASAAVLVWIGASRTTACSNELQIHYIPVLFGGGRWMFGVLPSRVELDIVRVIDTPQATHVRYPVGR